MAVNKAHDEFYALDLENGWEVPAGYPAGIEQKILSGSLDESKRRGSRTRLLRIAPGVFSGFHLYQYNVEPAGCLTAFPQQRRMTFNTRIPEHRGSLESRNDTREKFQSFAAHFRSE